MKDLTKKTKKQPKIKLTGAGKMVEIPIGAEGTEPKIDAVFESEIGNVTEIRYRDSKGQNYFHQYDQDDLSKLSYVENPDGLNQICIPGLYSPDVGISNYETKENKITPGVKTSSELEEENRGKAGCCDRKIDYVRFNPYYPEINREYVLNCISVIALGYFATREHTMKNLLRFVKKYKKCFPEFNVSQHEIIQAVKAKVLATPTSPDNKEKIIENPSKQIGNPVKEKKTLLELVEDLYGNGESEAAITRKMRKLGFKPADIKYCLKEVNRSIDDMIAGERETAAFSRTLAETKNPVKQLKMEHDFNGKTISHHGIPQAGKRLKLFLASYDRIVSQKTAERTIETLMKENNVDAAGALEIARDVAIANWKKILKQVQLTLPMES